MIETVAHSEAAQALPAKPAARDDVVPGFSFSAAMIALEGRASASLQTFGAAPGAGAPGQKTHAQSELESKTATAKSDPAPRKVLATEPQATGKDKAQLVSDASSDAKPLNQQAQPSLAQPAVATPITAASVAMTAQPPAQARTARTEAAVMRDTTLAKTIAPKAPRPVLQAQAPTQAQDFAHFLSKKLNSGATSFEMRLNPPQLGRVDAHLTISDDGEAVVSLQFENQDALDLFARDEAGLRTALSSSGHDFDQHQFTFSLRDQLEGADIDASPAAITASVYEPVFAAPFSTGAVDLRL